MAAAREPPIYALPNWRVEQEEGGASVIVTGWIDAKSSIPTKIKPHLTGLSNDVCRWYCGKPCKVKRVVNVSFSVTSVKKNPNGWYEFRLGSDFVVQLYDGNVAHSPSHPRPKDGDIEKILKTVMK